jgi:flavin reductase (DIM6/NTAB) family NADH-FMN oxidoreductase RutF
MDPKALYKLSYGMFVVSSKKGAKFNGQICNTVFQITSEPPTVGASINKNNLTHEFIDESKVFAVSILGQSTPLPFIGRFGFHSGRDTNKFEGINYKMGKTGCPCVQDNAVAFIEARVVRQMDAGTHTIFIGEIVDAAVLNEKEDSMTYSYYQQVKRGVTPVNAPTYQPSPPPEQATPSVQSAQPSQPTKEKEETQTNEV